MDMKKIADMSTLEFFQSCQCALTHNIDVCQKCKKCGEDAGEIRVALMNRLAKELLTPCIIYDTQEEE